MTKTEQAAKNRIHRRSEQALRKIADIEKLANIIYDCAGETGMRIVSHVLHDLALIRQNFETLRNRNKV